MIISLRRGLKNSLKIIAERCLSVVERAHESNICTMKLSSTWHFYTTCDDSKTKQNKGTEKRHERIFPRNNYELLSHGRWNRVSSLKEGQTHNIFWIIVKAGCSMSTKNRQFWWTALKGDSACESIRFELALRSWGSRVFLGIPDTFFDSKLEIRENKSNFFIKFDFSGSLQPSRNLGCQFPRSM